MNINISIIDQRVKSMATQYEEKIKQQIHTNKTFENDKHFFISASFVLLCIQTVLEISLETALDCLTEGGNDAGIDGVHIGDVQNGEFIVTLFQGKYKQTLEGTANFPENAIIKILNTTAVLFDPGKSITFNRQLEEKIEEIRSLVRDGYIPNVHIMLCNNGLTWNDISQQYIDNNKQVQCSHINQDKLVDLLQQTKPINDDLKLVGEAIVEEFNYRRILVGKVSVTEIKKLLTKHGNKLLERNIRHYLGLENNWVNQGIKESLIDTEKRQNFYFYNNGITMICSKFRHNALQNKDFLVKIDDLQIINGGQTCLTIKNNLENLQQEVFIDQSSFENTYVLLRLYELDESDEELVHDIIYATNSQNPVELRDLKSNDSIQKKLVMATKSLDYTYKPKRDNTSDEISSQFAAEAILAIWRCKPYQLRINKSEIFGHQFYSEIFNDELNAAQLIIAVLILKMVRNKTHDFSPYSEYFMAMLIGKDLLQKLNISLEQLEHQNFIQAKETLEMSFSDFVFSAQNTISLALIKLYGKPKISLQQLSATFRRGDLLEYL